MAPHQITRNLPRLEWLFVVCMVLMFLGCDTSSDKSQSAPEASRQAPGLSVRTVFTRQVGVESARSDVRCVVLRVTGPDIADIVAQRVITSPNEAVVFEVNVPVGNDRVFTVEAFPEVEACQSGSLIPNFIPSFIGEESADVPSTGARVTVEMFLVTEPSRPVANAGPDQLVLVTQTVQLDGSQSSDVDGDPLTFRWAFTSIPTGSRVTLSDPGAVRPTFVVDLPGDYAVQLVVNDGQLDSLADTVIVSTENIPPVASAGPDQLVPEGTLVTLNGTNSTDPDGTIVSFAWTRLAGPAVTLSNAALPQPTFTTPTVGASGAALEFELQVTDNEGLAATDRVLINVSNVNLPPMASAGPDQFVPEGTLVTLNGANSTDPDGTIVSFAWTQTAGPAVTLSNTALPQPSFTAPTVGTSGAALEFELRVTDDGGLAATDRVLINVSNVNLSPVANAGPDQTVLEGTLVTLNGANSTDPDGTIVSFAWTQVVGPAVTLSNVALPQPSFTAPAVGTSGAALEFELRVTDDGGLAATDRVIINVSNVNLPPVANAGPDQTVLEGTLVTLNGANSTDPDGTIVSFAWTQTAGPAVTLSNAALPQPSFTAPAVGTSGAALEFELRVTDDVGLAATDRVLINVSNVSNLTARCQQLLVSPATGCGISPCVQVRFTESGNCQQLACTESVAAVLRAEGIDARAVDTPLPDPPGCIGFRPDIKGTEEGAQCLVDLLGPPYQLESQLEQFCRVDGFSYNIRVP